MLFIHHDTPETTSSLDMSNLIVKLENEHNELLASIRVLEHTAQVALEHFGKSPSTPISADPRVDSFSAEPHHVKSTKMTEGIDSTPVDDGSHAFFPELISYNTPNSKSSSSVLVVGGTGSFQYLRFGDRLAWLYVLIISCHPCADFVLFIAISPI